MKQNSIKPNLMTGLGLILSAAALVSCSSTSSRVTASLPDRSIAPDSAGTTSLDVDFNIPARYLSSRSRLVITPALFSGGEMIETYGPAVAEGKIYAKKAERLERLRHIADPFDSLAVRINTSRENILPYRADITIPDSVDAGELVAILSSDGCGVCTGTDTIPLAAFSNLASLADLTAARAPWIDSRFEITPKVAEGKGVANLQFRLNKSDIDLSMGNNRAELDSMTAALEPILTDSLAILNSLSIFGMASADGPLKLNTPLSRNRAETAKRYLSERLGIPAKVQKIIKVGSKPEGWEPVLEAMLADNHPGAADVRAILEKYAGQNDDVAEKYIRRLSCWNDIKERYLQKDRKVEYVYSYTIRSFTDGPELLEMFEKRPDAFNESEFLRTAELMGSDADRIRVLETMLRYYPQSETAVNNLAALYLRNGRPDEGRAVVEKSGVYNPTTMTTLAASYIQEGDLDKAASILKDKEGPEARYDLGLIRLRQRRHQEAYELLREFDDLNAAIAALNTGRLDRAAEMMDRSGDSSQRAEYLRAVIATRKGDAKAARFHLENITDPTLLYRAASEPDFKYLSIKENPTK